MADYNRLVAARVSISTQEVLGSIMGRATIGAIEEAVSKITSYFDIRGGPSRKLAGKVLAVLDPNHFIISLGSNQGLKPNDALNVYSEVEVGGFKERQLKGSLEVVESQPERARVKLISGSGIKVDDVVIREAPKATAEEHIKKGLTFFEQGFYAQARDEFNQAKQLSPNSAEVFEYIGLTNLFLKNWHEAASAWRQAIAAGGSIEFPVYHRHGWRGICFGSLIVGPDFLEFKPPSGENPVHGFRLRFGELTIYISEKGRISAQLVDDLLAKVSQPGLSYRLAELDALVITALRRIPRHLIPEMQDRIIAATAKAAGCALLTRNGDITASGVVSVIWK